MSLFDDIGKDLNQVAGAVLQGANPIAAVEQALGLPGIGGQGGALPHELQQLLGGGAPGASGITPFNPACLAQLLAL